MTDQNPRTSDRQLGVRPSPRAVAAAPHPGVRLDVRRPAADRRRSPSVVQAQPSAARSSPAATGSSCSSARSASALGIQALIRRISADRRARPVLRLRGVAGPDVGLIVSLLHRGRRSRRRSFSAAGDLRRRGGLRLRRPSGPLTQLGGFLFMGAVRLIVASVVNLVPRQQPDRLGRSPSIGGRHLHGPDRVRRPADLDGDYAAHAARPEKAAGPRRDPPVHQLHQHLPVRCSA